MNENERKLVLAEMMSQTNTSDIDELQQLLKKKYYEGNPLISDARYDEIFPTEDLGYKLSENTIWPKFEHKMASIAMTKYKEIDLAHRCIEMQGVQPDVIEHKLDGINITLYYEDGALSHVVTRGSGIEGEDIYINGVNFKGVVREFKSFDKYVAVRGELVISVDDFNSIDDNAYSNRRNAVAGIARRLDGKYSNLLTFYAYKYAKSSDNVNFTELASIHARNQLMSYGFIVPQNLIDTGKSLGILYTENALTRNDLDIYQHDGLVVKSASYEFALKYNANSAETTVTGYTWSLGNSNKLVPVVTFEPVVIGGATLSKASIASFKNYTEINAPIGSIVEISRANEVIPYLKSVVYRSQNELCIPTVCPECGQTLTHIGANLVCENIECPHRLYALCDKFVQVLDVRQFTSGIVHKLIDAGRIKCIADLFNLTEEDLSAVRIGKNRTTPMIAALRERFKQFTQIDIISAMNIPSVSVQSITEFNTLVKNNNLDIITVFNEPEKFKYLLISHFKKSKTDAIIKHMTTYHHILVSVVEQLSKFN